MKIVIRQKLRGGPCDGEMKRDIVHPARMTLMPRTASSCAVTSLALLPAPVIRAVRPSRTAGQSPLVVHVLPIFQFFCSLHRLQTVSKTQ